MLAASQRAVELETDRRSPFYAIANAALGQATYVLGDLDRAVVALGAAARSDGAPKIIKVLSLSAESFVQAERGDVARSRECAELAMTIVDARGMRVMPQASLAFAALGQAQAAAGKVDEALVTLELGLAMRRKNPALTPWQTIHHLIVMSRVALREARQLPLAQELLAETAQRMDRYHDGMRAMRARLAAVQEAMRSRLAASAKSEPLTSRELDVLRHLQGSSSLSQIAGELYLSPNTVKTHTKALYRKLGAGSRSDAVHIARQRLLI